MKPETLQQVLKSIQDNGFAMIVHQIDTDLERPWAYTVGLFAKAGLDSELVFTETYPAKVYIDLIDYVVGLASDGEIAFEAIFDIAGYLFMLRQYEPEEYVNHPLAAAKEYFNTDVPAIKVIVLDTPR